MRPFTDPSAPSSSMNRDPTSTLGAPERPLWASSFVQQVNASVRNMDRNKTHTAAKLSNPVHALDNVKVQAQQSRQASSKWRRPERRPFIAIGLAIILTTTIRVGTLVAVGKTSSTAQQTKEPYPTTSAASLPNSRTTSSETTRQFDVFIIGRDSTVLEAGKASR